MLARLQISLPCRQLFTARDIFCLYVLFLRIVPIAPRTKATGKGELHQKRKDDIKRVKGSSVKGKSKRKIMEPYNSRIKTKRQRTAYNYATRKSQIRKCRHKSKIPTKERVHKENKTKSKRSQHHTSCLYVMPSVCSKKSDTTERYAEREGVTVCRCDSVKRAY